MANPDAVVLRVVGDTVIKPGDTTKGLPGEPEIKQAGVFIAHYYAPISVQLGTKRVVVEIDLSVFSGKRLDLYQLVMYGVDFSSDDGRTWLFPAICTAGDNSVPIGFPLTSRMETECPRDDQGYQVLVRPFVGGKYPLDIGIKVSFL